MTPLSFDAIESAAARSTCVSLRQQQRGRLHSFGSDGAIHVISGPRLSSCSSYPSSIFTMSHFVFRFRLRSQEVFLSSSLVTVLLLLSLLFTTAACFSTTSSTTASFSTAARSTSTFRQRGLLHSFGGSGISDSHSGSNFSTRCGDGLCKWKAFALRASATIAFGFFFLQYHLLSITFHSSSRCNCC